MHHTLSGQSQVGSLGAISRRSLVPRPRHTLAPISRLVQQTKQLIEPQTSPSGSDSQQISFPFEPRDEDAPHIEAEQGSARQRLHYTLATHTMYGARFHSVITRDVEFALRLYEQALKIDIDPEHAATDAGHYIEFVATDEDCRAAIVAAGGAL